MNVWQVLIAKLMKLYPFLVLSGAYGKKQNEENAPFKTDIGEEQGEMVKEKTSKKKDCLATQTL